MKKIIAPLVILLGISYASAASPVVCTDITSGLARFQESSAVFKLQQFLFSKGYLKATPNGYFGLQTFSATKQYQASLGYEPVGTVGPMTRAAIKKESCNVSSTVTNSNNGNTIVTPTTNGLVVTSGNTSISYAPVQYPSTPAGINNTKRRDDITALLKALYTSFTDSRGVHSVMVSDTPIELCANTKPLTATVASTSNSAVVVTDKSPCADFVDIADLVPRYMQSIPRDPKLATSSALIGYTITRSATNDIVIASKTPEDNAIIQITCNFNGFCKNIQYISTKIYKRPEITTMNRSIFLQGAFPRTPLIIKGTNFTANNKIKLFSLYNSKEYILGEINSSHYSATTTAVSIEGSLLNREFSCGTNCTQKIPLGDYMLSIINEGGESNSLRIVFRGFTTSSISTQVNGPVIPTSKNNRVGTITLSSAVPVTLKSLTFVASSTSKNLPSKISNITLKDTSDGTTYTASGEVVSFGDLPLFENQSKVYEVYVDADEVLNVDAGFITYGGNLLLSDDFGYVQLEIPIKEFSFSVSH
jgi:hypothetical protein